MRFRLWPRQTPPLALLLVLLSLLAAIAGLGPASAEPARPERIFVGSIADHFVDPTGQLPVDAVAADGSLFAPANGRAANRGVSPTPHAALWLRLTLPTLGPLPDWVLSLHESRISRAVLFVPDATGWRSLEWNRRADHAEGEPLLRYPAFHVDGAQLAGRTVYLRIETTSSMRALLWLETESAYTATYGQQALAFGALIGALVALFAYVFAIGAMLKDGALLRLSLLVLTFVAYVASDRAILETALLPGAFDLSRIVSLASSLLVFAAWLSFEACYLKLRVHRPGLYRATQAAVGLIAVCAALVVVEMLTNTRVIRLYSSYIGLASLAAGVVLAVVMMRHEWRRAGAFLLCWLPALGGGMARLSLDAGGMSPDAAVVNAVYWGAGLSLLIFGIVVSLDLQARERGLLLATQSSEARFRSFADSASDSFWESDAGGRLTYLTGRLDDEELKLATGSDLIAGLRRLAQPPDQDGLAALEEALRGRRAFRSVVLALRDPSGATRYLSFSGAPACDPDGRYGGHRGVFSDVTREVLLRERHVQQQKMAALGQLAGGVAHEINNLLHPIINLTRRIRGGLDPRDERRYQMGIVEDAGLRAQEIVASVLATAHPAPQQSPAAPLREALTKALDAVRPVIPAAVALDLRIDPVEDITVPTGEMLQVMSNLVSNAVHALHGSGRIGISLAASGKATGAVLCVADNGVGMDPETRRHALEPFFTTKDPGSGTGLGLPVVYGIVTGWGASIDILSEPGRGTKIVITFPGKPGPATGKARGDGQLATSFDHR